MNKLQTFNGTSQDNYRSYKQKVTPLVKDNCTHIMWPCERSFSIMLLRILGQVAGSGVIAK